MRIGIDARFFGEAGPGRYTKSIIEHLEKLDTKNEYIIFLTSNGMKQYHPKNPRFTKIEANYTWYSFEEQTKLLFKVLSQNLDIYYVPHFNIPIFYPKRIVTAIPDMTMHKYSTEKGTTLPLWYFRIKVYVYKLVFWWAVFRSRKVIVPSKTIMKDFLKYLNFEKDKYVLAYEGVDPDLLSSPKNTNETLKKYGITRNFVLTVGSMYEHKNIQGMINAYKILKEKYGYTGQYVLASKKDKFSKKVYDQIKGEGLNKDILVLAYRVDSKDKFVVSDQEIINLRSKADLYMFAPFTEGFSLTSMEGMAQGLPSVLSDIDCHREVYKDSVLYANPYNPKDIAQKVNELLTNLELKQDYINRGYAQIDKYDWLKTAQITLDVFNSI